MTRIYECDRCEEQQEQAPAELLTDDGRMHLCDDCWKRMKRWINGRGKIVRKDAQIQ